MDSKEPSGFIPPLENNQSEPLEIKLSAPMPDPDPPLVENIDHLFHAHPGSKEFGEYQKKLHGVIEHLKSQGNASTQVSQKDLEDTIVRPILHHLQSRLGAEISSIDYLRQIKLVNELMPLIDKTVNLTPELKAELEEFIKKYGTTQYRVIDESKRLPIEPVVSVAEPVPSIVEYSTNTTSTVDDLKKLGIPEKFLENRTILELIKRFPPELLDPDSSVSFESQSVRINGVDYRSLQFEKNAEVGQSQIQGTGRMVCDAGEEVIKVDRLFGNNQSGGIVEVLLWDKAQENHWLMEQLLPLTKWGFIKGSDQYRDRLYVYVVFPKVTEFYPAKVSLKYDWDTQGEVADLGGGITQDASGSNIGRYSGRWVIIDYNAPYHAAIFGGKDYYSLLQKFASCIRELSDIKRNKPDGWYEKYGELNKTKHELEIAIEQVKSKYRERKYIETQTP